jgi:hypothetical protein
MPGDCGLIQEVSDVAGLFHRQLFSPRPADTSVLVIG